MKNFLWILLLSICLPSCIISSKPNMDFACDMEIPPKGVHIISVNPPLFLAKPFIIEALKEDGENAELVKLFGKIKKVHVMCLTIDSLSDYRSYRQKMAQRMDNFLHKKNYEDYASIRNKGQIVSIHALQDGDIIHELMIQTISPKDGDVYVQVKAKISTEDLSRLINMAQDKN